MTVLLEVTSVPNLPAASSLNTADLLYLSQSGLDVKATLGTLQTFVGGSSLALTSTVTPLVDGTAAIGAGAEAARSNHVHPTDTSRAPLANPAFTGSITLPTWTTGTRPAPVEAMEGYATDTHRRETYNGTTWVQYVRTTDVIPVANGGTGTTTPGIVAGTNVTVTGTWPNQTINAAASAPSTVPVTTVAASGTTQTLTAPANGSNAYDVTLTAACTFTLAGGTAGQQQTITLYLRQDATAGRVPTLPSNVRWPGGTAPTPNSAAGIIDVFTFTTPDAGATWFGAY